MCRPGADTRVRPYDVNALQNPNRNRRERRRLAARRHHGDARRRPRNDHRRRARAGDGDVHAHPSRRGVAVELRANRLRRQASFYF